MAENQCQLDGFTRCSPTARPSENWILQLSAVKVSNGKVTRMGDSTNTDRFDRKRLASTLTATEQISKWYRPWSSFHCEQAPSSIRIPSIPGARKRRIKLNYRDASNSLTSAILSYSSRLGSSAAAATFSSSCWI